MMDYLEEHTLGAMLSDVDHDLDRVRQAILAQGPAAAEHGDAWNGDMHRGMGSQPNLASSSADAHCDTMEGEMHRSTSSQATLGHGTVTSDSETEDAEMYRSVNSQPILSYGNSASIGSTSNGDLHRSASSQAFLGYGVAGDIGEVVGSDLLRISGELCSHDEMKREGMDVLRTKTGLFEHIHRFGLLTIFTCYQ